MSSYLNTIGGTIPQVRVQRISLSSGGNTIVEDNPHIVETGFEVDGGKTIELAAKIENALDDFYDITSPALTVEERREYISRAWSGSPNPRQHRGDSGAYLTALRDFSRDNGRYQRIFRDWVFQRLRLDQRRNPEEAYTAVYAEAMRAYAINKFVQEFLARSSVRNGPWKAARFQDVFADSNVLNQRRYGYLRTDSNVIDKFGPVEPWNFPEGDWMYETSAAYDPGLVSANLNLGTISPDFAIEQLISFIESPELTHEYTMAGNVELLLNAQRSYNITLAGLKEFDPVFRSLNARGREINGHHHTALQTIVLPFIYEIVKRGAMLYYQDIIGEGVAWERALASSRLYAAQDNTAATSDVVSVKTLVNVKVTQPANTVFSSFSTNEQMAQQLEFVTVWAYHDETHADLGPLEDVLEGIGRKLSWATTEVGWGQVFNLNADDPRMYLNSAMVFDNLDPRRVTSQVFNLFEMMEEGNNPYHELQREATLDKDGNRVYDINFELPEQFVNGNPRSLRLYILPYLNVVGFIQQLNQAADVDLGSVLNEGTFGKYAPFFVGNPSAENIVENGALVRMSSVFVVDENTTNYKAGEQWKGPVFWDTTNADPAKRFKWYGGERRSRPDLPGQQIYGEDPNQEMPLLRREYVPNNKIQDNRVIDRLQRLEYNLGLTDIKEFLPSIGGLLQENNSVIYQKLDPVTDIHITSDSDRVNKLFFGIDMETTIFQNSPIGAFFRRLPPPERAKVLSHIEINSLEIIRHQVRDTTPRNRLGGEGTGFSNVGTRETARAPFIVAQTADMPTYAVPEGAPDAISTKKLHNHSTEDGRLTEVTHLLANQRRSNYTQASTLHNFSYSVGKARFFSAEDLSASSLMAGTYQYGVKFKILDKTAEYMKNRKTQLRTLENDLSQYYNLLMDNKNYNNALNRPHDLFIEKVDGPNPTISENVKTIPERLYGQNGVFINTLAALSENPSNFNRQEVSNILRGFLSVCTCSRDTVHRILRLLQNTLSKLDELTSVSAKPHYPNSIQRRPANPGDKTIRVFTVERKSTKTFESGRVAANGYYYLNARYTAPNSARLINATDGGDWQRWEDRYPHGIRVLKAQYMDALARKEVYKSFYDRSWGGILENANVQLVAPFASDTQYSYLTPQYIVLDAHGSNSGQDSEDMRKYPETLQNPNLFVFEHSYNFNAAQPHYAEQMEAYDLVVARVRLLNKLVAADTIPAIAEDFYTRPPRNPNVQIPNRSDRGRLEDTLDDIFAFQNTTVFKKSSFNYLLNRMVRGVQNLDEAIGQDDNTPSAASLLGLDDSFTGYIDPYAVGSQLGSSVYFRTFDVPSSADTTKLFDAILDSQKTSLSRRYIDFVFSDRDGPAWQRFELALQDFNTWPNSVKLVHTAHRGLPNDTKNVSGLWQRRYDGFVDVHLNKTMEVQVLDGFNTMEDGNGSILLMDSPRWRPARAEDFDYNVLCRIVPYQNDALRVVHPSYLDMNVFDDMFIVKGRLTQNENDNPVMQLEAEGPQENGACDPSYAVSLPLEGVR